MLGLKWLPLPLVKKWVGTRASYTTLTLGFIFSACSVANSPTSIVPPSPSQRNPEASCELVPVRCKVVIVNGHSYRYTVDRSKNDTSESIIVDLGGPGLSLFGSPLMSRLRSLLPTEITKGRNLLLIEEPWVTMPLSPKCRSAMSAFYQAVANSESTKIEYSVKAKALAMDCLNKSELYKWGWRPETYTAALNAIISMESLNNVGFIGFSFGALRAAYTTRDNNLRLNWAVLYHPAAPPGPATSFLGDRTSAIAKVLTRAVCGSPCPKGADFSNFIVKNAAAALPERGIKTRLRTPPVRPSDVASAAVAIAMLPEAERRKQSLVLLNPKKNLNQIGRLSDAVWMRYSEESLSPAYLGYLSEVCFAYHSWNEVETPSSVRSTKAIIELIHLPCRYVETAGEGARTIGTMLPSKPCLVASLIDSVAPAAFAESWGRITGTQVRYGASKNHADLEDLQLCVSTTNPR